MSKAILVMEMPECCSKCMFLYEFSGIKNCNLMNMMYGGASRLSQSNFTKCRHEKCPLRPMPEKKPLKGDVHNVQRMRSGELECLHRCGRRWRK